MRCLFLLSNSPRNRCRADPCLLPLLPTAETTARTEGHTLGNDFSLRGIEKQTGREGDHVEPNVVPGESGGTAGPGGDYKHTDGLQGHEVRLYAPFEKQKTLIFGFAG